MSFVQGVKARVRETEKNLKKSQETIALSGFRGKALTEKVSWSTKKLSAVLIEPTKLHADVEGSITLLQGIKHDAVKSRSTAFREVQNTYDDVVSVVNWKILNALVDG